MQHQRGLSLVELMVAVAIGLLTVLAITQAMSFFDTQRRGSTTGADAQSNGALATYMLERELRLAGYGIYVNDDTDAEQRRFINACARGSVRLSNSERLPADIEFRGDALPFIPVIINPPGIPAGDANTDVVGLAYGVSSIGLLGKGADIATPVTASSLTVENTSSFLPGDLMLLVPPNAATPCSVYEVTGGPPRVCTESNAILPLSYGTAGYQNAYADCAVTLPTFNKAGGLGVTPGDYVNGQAFSIGNRAGLTFAYYAIRDGQLTRCNHIQADCTDEARVGDATVWTPLAAGIVALRAELGIADTPTGTIDTWRPTLCAGAGCVPTADEWLRLRAVRIAVVARSQQPANVASVAPSWKGGEEIELNDPPNRFRYHTTEVVVPLRNLVWGGSE